LLDDYHDHPDHPIDEAPSAMSATTWTVAEAKAKRTGNLAEFFAASPLRGSGMKARRIKDRPRPIRL
jgi:hypothetical protein